jgi:hypothetical protein
MPNKSGVPVVSVVFTGLPQARCEELIRLIVPEAGAVYMPPQDFLKMWRLDGSRRAVWLYRAPWSISKTAVYRNGSQSASALLNEWLTIHRALLRKRRSLAANLVLVDADHTHPRELLHTLGLAFDQEAAVAPAPSGIDSFLSQAFAAAAPELWDVYEALNALAWKQPGATDEAQPFQAAEILQMHLDAQALPVFKEKEQRFIEELASQAALMTQTREQAAQLQKALEETTKQYTEALAEKDEKIAGLHQAAYLRQQVHEQDMHHAMQKLSHELAAKEDVVSDLKNRLQQQDEEFRQLRTEMEEMLHNLHKTQEHLAEQILGRMEMEKHFKGASSSIDRARLLICQLMEYSAAPHTGKSSTTVAENIGKFSGGPATEAKVVRKIRRSKPATAAA